MLQLKELDVTIGSRVLLPSFCASWPMGSLVAILGPNGCGKTTLLNHIVGLRLKTAGSVILNGCDVYRMRPKERALHISSVSQHDAAPLETRVFDRISHGLYPVRNCFTHESKSARISEVAKRLAIHDLLERPLFKLSGGQRKKVHIARALVHEDADMFVLDEPDASLDTASREGVLELLRALSGSGKLVIVSLHHRELASTYADIIVDLASRTDPQLHPPVQQTHPSC
jgi:iron complex transport system ATP-binding protein